MAAFSKAEKGQDGAKRKEDDSDEDAFTEAPHHRPASNEIIVSAELRGTQIEQQLSAAKIVFRFSTEAKAHVVLQGDIATVFLSKADLSTLSLKLEAEVFGNSSSKCGSCVAMPLHESNQNSLRSWLSNNNQQQPTAASENATAESEIARASSSKIFQMLELFLPYVSRSSCKAHAFCFR
jgi:hypothetical protein